MRIAIDGNDLALSGAISFLADLHDDGVIANATRMLDSDDTICERLSSDEDTYRVRLVAPIPASL